MYFFQCFFIRQFLYNKEELLKYVSDLFALDTVKSCSVPEEVS